MGCAMTVFDVSDELVERLSTETGRRLCEKARKGRRRALRRISHFAVLVTYDGVTTEEITFETAPTLSQIAARTGQDAYIVSIGMKRRSLRERFGLNLPLTAEQDYRNSRVCRGRPWAQTGGRVDRGGLAAAPTARVPSRPVPDVTLPPAPVSAGDFFAATQGIPRRSGGSVAQIA